MRGHAQRPRVLPCLAWGLGAALGRTRLIAVLWSWHALIAAGAAMPVFLWLEAATADTPASDPLLHGFSLDLFTEALHYGTASGVRAARAAAAGAMLLAAFSAPVLLGAAVVAVTRPGSRVGTAVGGALRQYWAFFRLLLLGRGVTLVLAALVLGLGSRVATAAGDGTSEPLWVVALAAQASMLALMAAIGLAATDYALLEAARSGSRRAWRCWWSGVAHVGRHPVASLGLWCGAGILLAGAAGVYLLFRSLVPSHSWILIVLMIAVQQAFVVTRVLLRVALLGAEHKAQMDARPPAPPATVQDERLQAGVPEPHAIAIAGAPHAPAGDLPHPAADGLAQ